MHGLSNGDNISDLRWPLKAKVKLWKFWSQISQERYAIERKCQDKLDRKSCMGFRMVKIFLISGDLLKSKVKVKRPPPPIIEEHCLIPDYSRYAHSKPTQNSGWSPAGCIGCRDVLSAATKLRRLALCAFINSVNSFRFLAGHWYNCIPRKQHNIILSSLGSQIEAIYFLFLKYMGPSIKYVTLFLMIFDPPSPCHKLSQILDPPPKSMSHFWTKS